MIKQILCCALLVGQLFAAEEQTSHPFQDMLNDMGQAAIFEEEFSESLPSLEELPQNLSLIDLPPEQSLFLSGDQSLADPFVDRRQVTRALVNQRRIARATEMAARRAERTRLRQLRDEIIWQFAQEGYDDSSCWHDC